MFRDPDGKPRGFVNIKLGLCLGTFCPKVFKIIKRVAFLLHCVTLATLFISAGSNPFFLKNRVTSLLEKEI